MFLLKFLFYFIIILCCLLFIVPFSLKMNIFSLNKNATLEAGFFTTGKIKHSFSIQFVFLMLIFVLFDTEILFTFGLALNMFFILKINILIICFLSLTLLMEWKWNKLMWLS